MNEKDSGMNLVAAFSAFESRVKSEVKALRGSRIGPRSEGNQGNVSIEGQVVGFYCLINDTLHFWFMQKDDASPQTKVPDRSYRFDNCNWVDVTCEESAFDSPHLAGQFLRLLISSCAVIPQTRTDEEVRLEMAWDLLAPQNFDEVDDEQLRFMENRKLIKKTESGYVATDTGIKQMLQNTRVPSHYIYDGWNLEFCFHRTSQRVSS